MLLEWPLASVIEFARAQGFRAIEVWADFPHAHPDEMLADERARIRKALTGFERVSLHGPLGNASLASINPGIRSESLREHLAAVELAHDLGAGVLVTHPGDLRDRRFKAAHRLSQDGLARLAERGQRLGVTIAVENCGPYHAGIDQTTEDLASLVTGVGSAHLKACLDTGHAAVNKNLAELIAAFGTAIVHAHVHDNHGQRDEHLPMGRGSIDFSLVRPLLDRLDGVAVAEVVWERGRSTESLGRARARRA